MNEPCCGGSLRRSRGRSRDSLLAWHLVHFILSNHIVLGEHRFLVLVRPLRINTLSLRSTRGVSSSLGWWHFHSLNFRNRVVLVLVFLLFPFASTSSWSKLATFVVGLNSFDYFFEQSESKNFFCCLSIFFVDRGRKSRFSVSC